ncbi:MAG: hypothetical protein RIE73_01880 [Coleofasciculus sp. C1-SOL-03]
MDVQGVRGDGEAEGAGEAGEDEGNEGGFINIRVTTKDSSES